MPKREYATASPPEILKAFRLRPEQLPHDVPYMRKDRSGLDLPEHLTALKIRQIGATSLMRDPYPGGWALGDIVVWIRSHPDSPIPYGTFRHMLYDAKMKRQTIYNYQSVSRAFPLDRRQPGLSRAYHSYVRTFPRAIQKRLLAEAARNNWNLPTFVKETLAATAKLMN